jgi:hypothetical protein
MVYKLHLFSYAVENEESTAGPLPYPSFREEKSAKENRS